MKYLKLFEAYELDANVKDLINWDMINDLKEMSLEYIDEGFDLTIDIYAEGEKLKKQNPIYSNTWTEETNFLLYQIKYSHVMDELTSAKNPKLIRIDNMKYFVCLSRYGIGPSRSKSLALLDRIEEAYPNEKFFGWN